WIVRLIFFILGKFPKTTTSLVELSFIHFARWVIVPRRKFPHVDPEQPVEDLRYDYMLFFSNFNGTWNQYIDAFSAVLSTGLNAIWRWSEKFPGSVPVTPFKQHIARCQFDTDYYYTAYPYATTNDVKAAHRVQTELDALVQSSAGQSAEEFERAYRKFVVAVQCDLGETGKAPVGT
ncbi:MAG TPA: hypothetical protein VFR24_13890, partial [Candidatus Angelobacter sp.]|nr:hypothetical protein [Candidatus Angelobacter sp.]